MTKITNLVTEKCGFFFFSVKKIYTFLLVIYSYGYNLSVPSSILEDGPMITTEDPLCSARPPLRLGHWIE